VRSLITLAMAGTLLGCGHRQVSNDSSAAPRRTAEVRPTPAEPQRDGGVAMKTPKEECEELMNAVLPFAQRMLSRYRGFFPFGGAMGLDGKIIAVAGGTGSEHPASQEVTAVLEEGFREGARTGKYKATALVSDMLVVPPREAVKRDAIAVRLDHRDGYSVVVVFPYTIGPGGDVAIEAPYVAKGDRRIFPH
jgi:hypothetical protein